VYKIPCKLTDSFQLQYVIMTTNNRHYLFSKWRAVVRHASPSRASYYNWWPSLKWIQWTLAGICMQVINSYFPGYVQYCVLPNNFSIMPQKMTTHNPISIWFMVYFQPFAEPIPVEKYPRNEHEESSTHHCANGTELTKYLILLYFVSLWTSNSFVYPSPVLPFAQSVLFRSYEFTE